MDWKLMLTTFAAVFLAELGDKTQLAALSLSATATSRWAVFLGASIALVVATALAVLVGDAVARFLDPRWVRRIAGILFVAIGLFLVFAPQAADGGEGPEGPPPTPDAETGAH